MMIFCLSNEGGVEHCQSRALGMKRPTSHSGEKAEPGSRGLGNMGGGQGRLAPEPPLLCDFICSAAFLSLTWADLVELL